MVIMISDENERIYPYSLLIEMIIVILDILTGTLCSWNNNQIKTNVKQGHEINTFYNISYYFSDGVKRPKQKLHHRYKS